MTDDDPYTTPRRTLDAPAKRKTIYASAELALAAADAQLERIYTIAEDMLSYDKQSPRAQMKRQGRRIMNIIDQVDEALGLDVAPERKPSDDCA